jgi:hypothetical protein
VRISEFGSGKNRKEAWKIKEKIVRKIIVPERARSNVERYPGDQLESVGYVRWKHSYCSLRISMIVFRPVSI